MTPQELRNSILQLAIEGKLVKQKPNEGTGKELFERIIQERYIKTKKTNALSSVSDKKDLITLFEIPKSWSWISIEQCCDIYTGNSISENEKKTKYENLSNGYDYIGTKDLSFSNVISYQNGVKIPFSTNFKIAKSGSVLMCIEGGSAGRKIAILDRDVCFGNKLCQFNPCELLNTFLYYYLQSNEFRKMFSDSMSGIIGGVSINKIKRFRIPLPPLEEQKRIVAKIDDLMKLVDKYEVIWNELEKFNKKFPLEMEKSLLQYAIEGKLVEQKIEEGTGEELYESIIKEKEKLIKEKKIKKGKPLPEIEEEDIPFEIPSTWKWTRLQDICTKIVDGDHNPPSGVATKTDYLMLSAQNVENGFLTSLENSRYLSKEVFIIENERTKLKTGDLLVTIVGTLGRSCVYQGGLNLAFQRSVSVISSLINPFFLKTCFDSPYLQNFMIRKSSGTAQKGFYLNQVSTLLIPVPPLKEQERIVAKLDNLLPLCRMLTKIQEK